MSLQLLVIMVPVLFGLMGFAVDLGRLYLIRGELNQAANAMALAGAAQLLGTTSSLGNATTVAQLSLDNSSGAGNTYNFGSLVIGGTTGILSSTVNPPAFFATVTDATAAGAAVSGNQADGTTARHMLISINADAPLLFFGLLPGGESLKTSIAAQAVAGISAPVCVACGIEPFAVAAIDSTDTTNFGFGDPTAGALYTFAYDCTGTPAPLPLTTGTQLLSYVLINRYDISNANAGEPDQLYIDGAGGIMASADPNPTGSVVPAGCASIGDSSEALWASAVPNICSLTPSSSVAEALCGLQSRLDNTDPNAVCTALVTDFGSLSPVFLPDTDQLIAQTDPYTSYQGTGRRILTLPVVDVLSTAANGTMTVLGFRQFLLERNADGSVNSPNDPNGRFVAMYIGNPAPVKQGNVDDHYGLAGGNLPTTGPGKVVLHQMRRRRTKGNMILEAALWIPVLVLLVVSMIQFGKITYVYYTLKKIAYSAARYIAVQQGTDFCNPADANIQAAINFAITDQSTGQPLIEALTPDMLSIATECADPNNPGALGACDTSSCGGALGAQRPDYVVVNIPSGYPVTFRIPLLNPVPISLKPSVTIPFGGTAL